MSNKLNLKRFGARWKQNNCFQRQLFRKKFETISNYQLITNNHTSFSLRWKENSHNFQKVTKHYERDCLQNFSLLFRSLSSALIVRKSHILAVIYLFFVKIVLEQTWKTFNTKFEPHWKDRESSCHLRKLSTQNLCFLLNYYSVT